jgi:single-strand DNA-binding protein
MSFHTVIIVGNLGKDPEMRYTPSGQPVTSFNVAVNDNYTASSGEKVERTIWFRVSAWGKQAEVCNNYLKKGRRVLVEGTLTVDPATGGPKAYMKSDGTPGASLDMRASTVRFLSPRSEGGESSDFAGDSGSYDDSGTAPF